MSVDLRAFTGEADNVVSLYADLAPQERDMRHSRIRLARLIEEARGRLMERQVDRPQAAALLAPLESFAASDQLIEHREPAVALFAAPDRTEIVALPVAVGDLAVVASHFHIKPLIELFAADMRFYILALSSTSARLFVASRYEVHDKTPPDLPRSVEEVMAETEIDQAAPHTPVARSRSRGPAAVPTSRGFDSPDDLHKIQLVEHLTRLEGVLSKHLAQESAPVLLFAEPQVGGHLRQRGHLRNLVGEMISANPHGLTDEEIHRRSVAVMQPSFDQPVAGLLERIAARLGSGDAAAATKPEEVVAAAHFGRVDAALVAADAALWGTFDPDDGSIAAHGSLIGWDEDLLNLAAVRTIANGGPAYAVPRERPPRGALAAATLRY
ncbi:MAG: hypothetical protein FJX35_08030 [Alphaproteobacteria bacterium]|nr:hypothetical protein [Alphaproteobacteria bacterium]